MQGKNFDIFISYRRSDGEPIARIITETLKGKNYRCFLDYDKLRGGKFDERIEKAIKDAPVFIAVMTPDYLVRPKEDKEKDLSEEEKENQGEDWVYKEIEIANANNKYIISINHNKKIKSIPKEVPANIAKALGAHTFAEVHDGQTYASNMEDLIKGWISEIVPPPTEKTQGKANIEVSSDADCDILKAGEVIATIAKGGYNILKLSQGRHRLVCRSNEFSDIEQKVILEVNKDLAEDFIDVELADKIMQRRIEIEEEKEERDRAEREKQIAEAVRRLVQNLPAHPKTLTGHSGSVISVCWSPDGKYLASGSYDETVIIWDAKSGQELKIFEGHTDCVVSVYWSPDGKYLASRANDEIVIIWDADSGEKIKTFEGHSHDVECLYSIYGNVSWSPDGKYLASGSMDRNIIIWDASSGEKLKTLEGHSNCVSSVSWSPDGKYLASGSWDNTIIIWDAESGKILKTLEGHSYSVSSVSWSPDGNYLASGSADETLIIWDAESGESFKTLEGHNKDVTSVCWSPDGKYIVSGSYDKTVKIWDANSGEKLKTLQGHNKDVTSVCWSPDGKYIVSGSWDETVKIWGVE